MNEPGLHLQRFGSLLPFPALFLAAVLVYAGALSCGFVNWDDDVYVTGNALIRDLSPAGVGRMFTTRHFTDYLPVNLLSLALDYRLWGLDPRGYHAHNVLLHGLNACLLYALLARLFGDRRPAFLAALLFALHPLNVEAVAWVSQRKTVLSMFFFLAAWLMYARFR